MNANHPMKIECSAEGETLYWYGDLARYTGNIEYAYGGLFYEIEMLEGHLKGKTKYTKCPPKLS